MAYAPYVWIAVGLFAAILAALLFKRVLRSMGASIVTESNSDRPQVTEEKRAQIRERWLERQMAEHGLTREEAETLAHMIGALRIAEREAKRRGVPLIQTSWQRDIANLHRERCRFVSARDTAEKFRAGGEVPPEIRAHLLICADCADRLSNLDFGDEEFAAAGLIPPYRIAFEQEAARLLMTPNEYAQYTRKQYVLYRGGEDCCSLKERLVYARGGELGSERQAHVESCPGCKRMLAADREEVQTGGKLGSRIIAEWKSLRPSISEEESDD